MSSIRAPRFFSRLHLLVATLVCVSLPLLFSGCGTSVSANTTLSPTVSMTASPSSISAGGSSTLTVLAANASGVTVTGTDGSSYNLPANGGTQKVSPTATTTYTATATGGGGKAAATVTVTVSAGPTSGPTVTITANPTSVAAGTPSTLTVAATNATAVTVTGSDGSSYTLAGTGGTQSVSPTATTTYTATATGAGGATATATATVTVTSSTSTAPTVTITANPTSITAGSSSILTVTATNASTVTITGTDKSSYSLTATGGIQSVSPAATTTYTATATGPGGTVTATATLTVTANPVPTVTIVANPTSIAAGDSSTLTVTASNATQVTITGSDGSSYTLASSSGALQSVSPTKTTTYTATATGPGGSASATATITVTGTPAPTVTIAANPTTIISGNSSTLTVTAANATSVTIAGTDKSSYTLADTGGTQSVKPTSTTSYTVTATGAGGTVTASTTVTVTASGSLQSISHVIFMMQENHSFDNYFGMIDSYRKTNGWNVGDDGNTYTVDGIDPNFNSIANLNTISNSNDEGTVFKPFKLATTCVDDMSSAWLESYGDVSKYNKTTTRPILMNGFVHIAEGYAKSCAAKSSCSGSFTDTAGQRAMGYYDNGFLNYYYYMASNFALSDRWFSPVASKTIDNRIATYTGGTTQGLVKDPGQDDHLPALNIESIFQELDAGKVSWKIYYTTTEGFCTSEDDCPTTGNARIPAVNFSDLTYAFKYLGGAPVNGACPAPKVPSGAVGDTDNSFCIDPTHIAPIGDATYGYFADLKNGTLPSFAFIEAGYGDNDEHPGSNNIILKGQTQVASIINALMTSTSWQDSVFFFAYDEGGGPYDHVPPVPNHTNDYTTTNGQTYPDISSIAVDPDLGQGPSTDPNYDPCLPATPGTPTTHCDLGPTDPGATAGDAAAVPGQGFAAQLGFRVPNMVVSPFVRRHYVSHIPMDHTAVIKFVENRFLGPSAHLTARDNAQPNLLDFFDFSTIPWLTPPTPPAPVSSGTCNAASMGP